MDCKKRNLNVWILIYKKEKESLQKYYLSSFSVEYIYINNNMSDGKLEKMDKDFSPQVDALLPETEDLAKVINHKC